jgi:hypothetical protein
MNSPREALAFPAVAAILWLYIYVVLPCQLVAAGDSGLDAAALGMAQTTAWIAFAALQLGWDMRASRGVSQRLHLSKRTLSFARLWLSGLTLQLLGLVGYYTFVHSGRSFEDTSGYWYLLVNLCYPGISLCVAVLVLRPEFRTALNQFLLVAGAALVFVPFLAGARRGPTFAGIIAITFPYLACRPSRASFVKMASVVVMGGIVMLVLVAARRVVYDEGSWSEAVEMITLKDAFENRGRVTSDNEFANHTLQIEANRASGLYQYGTAHLTAFLNAIPRSIWSSKPGRGQGLFPEALASHDTDVANNLGHGGGFAVVADSFNNYGWFFPLFWFGIGYGLSSIYVRAFSTNDLKWKAHYVGIVCASHWFIAQTFAEAFVPAVIYQAGYYVSFKFALRPCQKTGRRRGRSDNGHKKRIHHGPTGIIIRDSARHSAWINSSENRRF